LTNAGSITNDNGGAKYVSGVFASNTQVVNTGKIVAIGMNHVAGVYLSNNSSLTNSGNISATGKYFSGVFAYKDNGSITNKVGGTITGQSGVAVTYNAHF
jgi:hypothetical protein